jgi:hypothetical protein
MPRRVDDLPLLLLSLRNEMPHWIGFNNLSHGLLGFCMVSLSGCSLRAVGWGIFIVYLVQTNTLLAQYSQYINTYLRSFRSNCCM